MEDVGNMKRVQIFGLHRAEIDLQSRFPESRSRSKLSELCTADLEITISLGYRSKPY